MSKERIIVYPCDDRTIHVYKPKCGLIPALPYNEYQNVDAAIEIFLLTDRTNFQIKTYPTIKTKKKK